MAEPLANTETPLILVVEDDDAQRSFLSEVLTLSGYECETASSCAESRDLFVKGRYACALIDLGLPDGKGLDLLEEIAAVDQWVVPIVLTGDDTADTIITTMRAGAFDYLTKPIEMATLKASINRAMSHHQVVRDKSELVRLLVEEREQLRARVEAATADIRQYAAVCETSNTRFRSLLTLTQLSDNYSSEETLLRSVFEELCKHMPLRSIAVCDIARAKSAAVYGSEDEEVEFVSAEGGGSQFGYDNLLAEAEPKAFVQNWVERNLGLDTSSLSGQVFVQNYAGKVGCAVGFYLDIEFAADDAEEEFLGMCARFIAFEWERGRLLLQVAHHASLGNIAVELARNFIQPLTAIRTAADFVEETVQSAEAREGMSLINDNVDRLRRQTQEFRRLSLLREDSIETVQLDAYIEQALDILSVAIQNRGVTVEKDIPANCECVLLNGTALARTFLDVILGALRAVDVGGTIQVSLHELDRNRMAFDVSHNVQTPYPTLTDEAKMQPGLQLAKRTVHTCGGSLSVELDDAGHQMTRVVLPSNATDPAAAKGIG